MLTHDQLKTYSTLTLWKTLFDIGCTWGIILTGLYACHISLWFMPLALPFMVSRLHALTQLFHDGSHQLLSSNRTLNDVISNLFCSFPLMISTQVYRESHMQHHAHTQTMNDPNYVIMKREKAWQYPKPASEMKRDFLRDVTLVNLPEHLHIFKEWQILPNFARASKLEKILFPIYLLTVLSAVTYFKLWPEFIILQAAALLVNPLARIRAMSEHVHHEAHGQGKMHKLQETPTINAGPLEKFFFGPLNSNRHLEHHLYPTVPYYNLENLHATIKPTKLYRENCFYELDGYLLGEKSSLREVLCKDFIDFKKRKAA